MYKSHPRLYVFSDGIYEVQKTDGAEMELDAFVEILRQPETEPGRKVHEVLALMQTLQGQTQFDDDVSLLEVCL